MSVDDPLARFRKGSSAALVVNHPVPSGGHDTYEAFDSRDRAKSGRLHIRCADAPSHYPGYNFIIDIACDERDYTTIMIIFNTMLVTIHGRNLKPVVESLAMGTCKFVQEFDPKRFAHPDDLAAPFIERIEVHSGREQSPSAAKKGAV